MCVQMYLETVHTISTCPIDRDLLLFLGNLENCNAFFLFLPFPCDVQDELETFDNVHAMEFPKETCEYVTVVNMQIIFNLSLYA